MIPAGPDVARRWARLGSTSGAVLVEMSFIALFLLVLCAGAFDYGLAWRASLGVNEASRTGARVGSAGGPAKETDYNILTGSRAALASSGLLDDVQRVVIYRSDSVGGDIPTVCKTATTTSQMCNILTGDQFRAIPTSSTSALDAKGCIAAALTRKWCPLDRDNIQLNADYVGVWIQARYQHSFTMLGSATTIERRAVMRLEPQES